jgi:hypothetical protein
MAGSDRWREIPYSTANASEVALWETWRALRMSPGNAVYGSRSRQV